MSPKKILFFTIVWIIFISIIIAVAYVSGQKKQTNTAQGSIKIWITDGTSESYAPLIEWFKKYAKEYAKTEIIVEKQTNDADRYRTILLSTLIEWSGPDIFMLHSWEDAILETKIEPITSDFLDFSDFDKKYDDIFQDLLVSSGSWRNKKIALLWVPLGYETLGVFYNKSLMREVPKTWNDLENLYKTNEVDIHMSNIGLSPTYTPNMVDILPIWFNGADAKSYADITNTTDSISSYLKYASLSTGNGTTQWTVNTIGGSLNEEKNEMAKEKFTTFDLFMRGKIAMIVGYPSLVLELEKSSKRAWSDTVSSTILTDRLPQMSNQSNANIGRYTYFGISKYTKNGQASLKFVEYLLTPEAERLFSNEYPYLIPAQSDFYTSVEWNSLSETLGRTKLAPFLPRTREKITIFQFWLKSRFERYLKESLDIDGSPDISSLLSKISREITCEISSTLWKEWAGNCQSD